MGVDEIVRTEFVQHGGVAREHGAVAPVLQRFDFFNSCIVLWLFGHIDLGARAASRR